MKTTSGQRITLPTGINFLHKSIEINFIDLKSRNILCNRYGNAVRLTHVKSIVTIISEKTNLIFPNSLFFVLNVINCFIYHIRSLLRSSNGETSNSNIQQIGRDLRSFAVVHKAKIIIRNIGRSEYQRIIGLIGQNQIVARVGNNTSVVVRTASEKEKVFRQIGSVICFISSVIQHFYEPTVRCGIRCSG